MADNDKREQLAALCKKLHISSHMAELGTVMGDDANQDFLCRLFEAEVEHRHKERISGFLNAAAFPRRYVPEQFHTEEIDFPDEVSFQSLLDLDFYKAGRNVIMYGGTGTGKTMLSILIGISACSQEVPVRFFRTAALINQFTTHYKKGSLDQFKKKLNTAGIIILDEFGYVPYDRTGSQLLFDYLSEIHELKSVILNTNLEFAQWVNVLYDPKMTTALIGRLTHHVELILFPGTNYRLKESSINEAFARMNRKPTNKKSIVN